MSQLSSMDWSQLKELLREALAQPGANLKVILLLLAALLLVLVLLIVLVLLLVALRPRPTTGVPQASDTRAGTANAPDSPTPRATPSCTSRVRRATTGGTVLALVLLAIASGTWLTSRDSYCAGSCHAGRPGTLAHQNGTHRTIACVACHEDPLPWGIVGAAVSRTRDVVAVVRRSQGGGSAVDIPSVRCLRCHSYIANKTIIDRPRAVRVSHREMIAAGMSCGDCHVPAGHAPNGTSDGSAGPAERFVTAPMGLCLRCHDGRTAPSTCGTCHVGDPSLTAAKARLMTTQPVEALTDCGGCHSLKRCDGCHGLRMPHPASFRAYEHARYGAFGGKQKTCAKCHDLATFCTRCHVPFATAGHASNWVTDHRRLPTDSYCSCHQAKMPTELQKRPFCVTCHAR